MRGVCPVLYQLQRKIRISIVTYISIVCIWRDQLNVVYYKLLCLYKLLKPKDTLKLIGYKWWIWADDWRKNGRYISGNMIKWFWSITVLYNMLQNWWKRTWKRLNISCRTLCIHQTLRFPIITCFGQWHKACMTMNMSNIELNLRSSEKTCHISDVKYCHNEREK